MRLGFLLSGSRPYSEGVRPLLDLAAGCRSEGHQIIPIAVDCSPSALNSIEVRFPGVESMVYPTLESFISSEKPPKLDVLLSTDYLPRLRALATMRKQTGVKTAAFTSTFFGLSVLRSPDQTQTRSVVDRIGTSVGRNIPFRWVSRSYRDFLARLDYVCAFSGYAAMITRDFFGSKVDEVVYPPVNSDLFREVTYPGGRRSGVLVFVGGRHDRSPSSYMEILSSLVQNGTPIHIFGDPLACSHIEQALHAPSLSVHLDVSTENLSELYNSVKSTFVTPLWEAFGYVGPESLLCGAPVVACTWQPWMEVTGETGPVRLIPEERLRADTGLLASPDDVRLDEVKRIIEHELSIKTSSRRLLDVICKS